MEFWFQAWKCPFYAPLRFQTHNEIMIAVRPAAAAVIWHVYHSIKTPNTLKITFDSYSKYIEYNIQKCFLSLMKKSLMYLYTIYISYMYVLQMAVHRLFILKFTEPLQSCCCPVQKYLHRMAELAWQLSMYLWRGSVNFKINYRPRFSIIFELKNDKFKTRDFSPLIERVLTGVTSML